MDAHVLEANLQEAHQWANQALQYAQETQDSSSQARQMLEWATAVYLACNVGFGEFMLHCSDRHIVAPRHCIAGCLKQAALAIVYCVQGRPGSKCTPQHT